MLPTLPFLVGWYFPRKAYYPKKCIDFSYLNGFEIKSILSLDCRNARIFCQSDFPWKQIRQILRLRAVIFDFRKIWHLSKAWNCLKIKIQSLWKFQNGHFWDSTFTKIDITENMIDRKILEFPHCGHKMAKAGNTDFKTRSSFVITKKVFIRMQHSRCNYVSILGSSIFWYIIINSRTFYISKEWVKRYQNWRDERNTGLATQNCCKNWNDEPCTTAAFWRWLNVLFCAGLYWGEFVRNWLFYLY